ncbi:MAG TPA: hypothetical protein EYP51_10660 [Thiotrichales bacterium]|nr:hypothetical protein [Thiotrichales bacterium]
MRRFRYLPFGIGLLLAANLLPAATPETAWGNWLENQISQHPEIIAARETMNAALSRADGQEQPLYNPELETEYEREGDADNYRVGVSQAIDWRDKRGTRRQQAVFNREAAQYTYALVVAQKTSDAMKALVEWQAARQTAELAGQQEAQLDTLLSLVNKRLRAGDLSQVDAELAILSLTQRLNAAAQAQVALQKARIGGREILPGWTEAQAGIPEEFWRIEPDKNPEQWFDRHPAVAAARAEWEMTRQTAVIARKATRADPSFGVNVGRSDGDDVLGLRFSVPLNIRNNFSAEAQAAHQQAMSAQSRYQHVRRSQRFAAEAAGAARSELKQRLERWQTLVQGLKENSSKLLERRWRSGDMGTAEFLLALQQRAEGLQAGIKLRLQYQQAHIDWLFQTGQLHTTLQQLD